MRICARIDFHCYVCSDTCDKKAPEFQPNFMGGLLAPDFKKTGVAMVLSLHQAEAPLDSEANQCRPEITRRLARILAAVC